MSESIRTEVSASIVRELALEFVDAAGHTYALAAEWQYRPGDPFAVTVVMRTDTQEVAWTFGRALLIDGRYEPTGDGDVHVWPCLSSQGSAVTIIELCSPDGELLVQADTRQVDEFVAAMLVAVPEGAETMDLDAELDQFFV